MAVLTFNGQSQPCLCLPCCDVVCSPISSTYLYSTIARLLVAKTLVVILALTFILYRFKLHTRYSVKINVSVYLLVCLSCLFISGTHQVPDGLYRNYFYDYNQKDNPRVAKCRFTTIQL